MQMIPHPSLEKFLIGYFHLGGQTVWNMLSKPGIHQRNAVATASTA